MRTGTHREIDPGRQAHRCDDHVQLSGFREWLNDAGAGGVAQAAVMIGDTIAEQLGKAFADDRFLSL
jgi:hypothetical protein